MPLKKTLGLMSGLEMLALNSFLMRLTWRLDQGTILSLKTKLPIETRTAPAMIGAMIRLKEIPAPRRATISKSLVMRPMPSRLAKR
ncbi:hypothetical protein D3C87_1877520 [compost metagenome]